MAKFFTIHLPTTTHLKKFMLKRYGMNGFLPINNDTVIGVFLITLLQKDKFYVHRAKQAKEFSFKRYNDKLACSLPISFINHYNYSISIDQAVQLNRFYENIFEEALYIFCARRINPHAREKGYFNAIYEFAELNDIIIGKDVTYDCLKKMEYRHRKSLEKKFCTQMSPQNTTVQYELFV